MSVLMAEYVATRERQWDATDFPVRVGQESVVQGRRWPVVEVKDQRLWPPRTVEVTVGP